jgi:hypothetical protein
MKTRIKVQHDYITVTAEPKPGFRLNMTWSWSREKITFSGPRGTAGPDLRSVLTQPLANEILRKMNVSGTKTAASLSNDFKAAFELGSNIEEALALL